MWELVTYFNSYFAVKKLPQSEILFLFYQRIYGKSHDHGRIENNAEARQAIQKPAMKEIPDHKWKQDQNDDQKFDHAEDEAIQIVMYPDLVYHYNKL